jgi:hypothetical protein
LEARSPSHSRGDFHASPLEELNRRGFALYEAFRPAIPAGARGWGATGELDLERITGLVVSREE